MGIIVFSFIMFILEAVLPVAATLIAMTFVLIDKTVSTSSPLQRLSWISIIFMLASSLLIFLLYWYEKKKNTEFSEMKLLLERKSDSVEYYKLLLSQKENQNILIHDIKKHLQSIAFLNENQEREKINTYIRQLLDFSDLQEFSRLYNDEILNMILHRYNKLCKNKNIAFHADIRHGSTNFIAETDLTALFCNLLDNAVDAAGNSPEAFIDIHMEKRKNTPFITLNVKNSCHINPLSPNNRLITLKPDKQRHGLGIKSIQKTVKNYNGELKMHYNEEDKTFHTNILLRHPI